MDKKNKNEERTGGAMKMKEKIMNYFHRYWRSRVFMKSVSVLVAVCFVINVANLPAYAQSGRRR